MSYLQEVTECTKAQTQMNPSLTDASGFSFTPSLFAKNLSSESGHHSLFTHKTSPFSENTDCPPQAPWTLKNLYVDKLPQALLGIIQKMASL